MEKYKFIELTDEKEKWTKYDIIFYLKQIPLYYGKKYTMFYSPFKYPIQNNNNGYISRLPVNIFLGYKHMLDLNSLSFYPYSIIIKYPNDYNKVKNKFNKYDYWILKPSQGTYGRNISIVEKDKVKKELDKYKETLYSIVCQRYIKNPLLVNNRKFDFRVYVLWIDNKVYVNKYFYTRFAKKEYKNYKNLESGLTNLSQHKILDYLVRNDEFMKRYQKEYPEDKANYLDGNLHKKIMKLVKEYFIYIKNILGDKLDFWNDKRNNYFNLYGFDLLPDENGKLWLLEVNISPGFNDNRNNSLIPYIIEDMIRIILKKKQKSFIHIV